MVIVMINEKHQNTERLLELLKSLDEIPPRDQTRVSQGKEKFLTEARSMEQSVSFRLFRRLNEWMHDIPALSFTTWRKENPQMFKALSAIVLVIAIALGGTGITAYAAQSSLPDTLLYPVKLFIEDTRYALTSAPERQVELMVSFANNRVDEIAGLGSQGDVVPEELMKSLENNLQTMLVLAAGMDENGTEGALNYIRQNLRTREQLMVMLSQSDNLNPVLEQLQAMLEAQHRIAQTGLDEPLKFQQQFRYNQDLSTENTEQNKNQSRDCLGTGDCDPQNDGNGSGQPNNQLGNGNQTTGEGQPLDDPGNPNTGNEDPGNTEPGNEAPGNPDSGDSDPGNTDPGDDDPGNTDPGNANPGNPEPGDDNPGNTEPGDNDPGNTDPGDDDPGNPDPGNSDPGNPNPGNGSIGDPNSGVGNPGNLGPGRS
jgi:hypothetical protein